MIGESTPSDKDIRSLRLDQIIISPDLQPRKAMDESHIGDLLADIEAGQVDQFPPAVVFGNNEHFFLADGFHRYEAHHGAKLETMRCEVRQGTWDDAFEYALSSNADQNALKRTPADKRRVVEMALAHPKWKGKPAREIGRACKVDDKFVSKVKKELSADIRRCDDNQQVEVTRGGTTYAMSTGNIGKRKDAADTPTTPPATPDEDYLPVVRDQAEDAEAVSGTMDATRERKAKPEKAPKPSRKAEKTTGRVMKDELGGTIPDHLRDTFADNALPDAVEIVDGWLDLIAAREVTKLFNGKESAYRFIDFPQLRADIDEAHRLLICTAEKLANGKPYALCPRCKGAHCKECRHTGYVPFWRHEELKENSRAA